MQSDKIFKNTSTLRVISNLPIEINSVSSNSTKADKDSIFIAKKGFYKDGKDFCMDAYKRGCRAFLTDAHVLLPPNCFLAISSDISKDENILLDAIYGANWEGMRFIGITGTKGKSTVAMILYKLLGEKDAVCIGTLGVKGLEYGHISNTTPDKIELRKIISLAANVGKKYVIIEASSQALKYGRLDGIRFDIAIFTNLSPDHISECEHKDFYDYLASKKRLFKDFGARIAIADVEERFAHFITRDTPKTVFSLPIRGKESKITNVCTQEDGTHFLYNGKEYTLSLFGTHNLKNALLATRAASILRGVNEEEYFKKLNSITISGRGEIIKMGGRNFIIDYAHNPVSFLAVAKVARALFRGQKTIAVFGSVGDRASERRRGLVKIAEANFDLSIITEDDTVFEKNEDICKQLYSYFEDKTKCMIVLDREKAIKTAARLSGEGDVILLLGKGHERTIKRHGREILFDEKSILSSLDF